MLMIVIQHISFYYVENYVTIPAQWEKNARIVCPKLRRGHLFHYNSFAGIGFLIVPPSFFFFKALAAGTEWQWTFGQGEKERGCDFMSLFVKIFAFLIIEFTCRNFLPNLIYGTKDVGIYPDFILKTAMQVAPMVWVLNSKWLQYKIDQLSVKDKTN